jgi:hypothetical protein
MSEHQQEEIKQRSISLMEAWKRQDRKALENHIADGGLFISELIDGFYLSKEDYIDMMLLKFPLTSFQYNFLKISIVVENGAAIVVSRLFLPSMADRTSLNMYLVTDTWNYQSGEWKLMTRQPLNL